jgi:hypothetical protein
VQRRVAPDDQRFGVKRGEQWRNGDDRPCAASGLDDRPDRRTRLGHQAAVLVESGGCRLFSFGDPLARCS